MISYVSEDLVSRLEKNLKTFMPTGEEDEKYRESLFKDWRNMKLPNWCNCAEDIRFDDYDIEKMHTLILSTMPPDTRPSADNFFSNLENTFLRSMLYFVRSECTHEEQNFASVMKLFCCTTTSDQDEEAPFDVHFNKLGANCPDSPAYRYYKVFNSVCRMTNVFTRYGLFLELSSFFIVALKDHKAGEVIQVSTDKIPDYEVLRQH